MWSRLFFNYREAFVWSERKDVRNEIYQRLSNHQKQFMFLPLHVLENATNIREVAITIADGRNIDSKIGRNLDLIIRQIHEQMARKCGQWTKELHELRFIEFVDEHTELEPSTPTAEEKKKKTSNQTARELKRLEVNEQNVMKSTQCV